MSDVPIQWRWQEQLVPKTWIFLHMNVPEADAARAEIDRRLK